MTTVPSRTVSPIKITNYLLNPNHEVGASKAAFFRSFGFSANHLDVITAALIAHPERNPIDRMRVDQWGTRYVVRCSIETPDGRNPCITSIWIVPTGQDEAQLVTAYPAILPSQ